MKILIAPDKFKDSLTADEVIKAVEQGIQRISPKIKTYGAIMSDGGDGFLSAVSRYIDCKEVWTSTKDPLGRAMQATYLIDKGGTNAYLELAKASGLELLKGMERNAMLTTTKGTGIQIQDAISKGVQTIYLGLGGSATNDGGIGIASALGYRFKDKNGHDVAPIGKNLSKIQTIEPSEFVTSLKPPRPSFVAVNDVNNPLFGIHGAAHVYGPQKGADPEQLILLDKGLRHLAEKVKEFLGTDYAGVPGAGAAGGTAYGLKTFLDAEFISGVNFIMGIAGVEALVKQHKIDYIITGEGKIDDQTVNGKLIKGLVDLGKLYKIPVIAVCGKLDIDSRHLDSLGLKDALEIMDKSKPVQYSMDNASLLIENTVYTYLMGRVGEGLNR